jgi:hypothetical protein
LPGRLLVQRLGPEQLIQRGIARIGRAEGDDRDAVQALAELLGRCQGAG